MEMFEFAVKFAFGVIKNFDLFLMLVGGWILFSQGTGSPASVIGFVLAIAGGVIFAMRKGLLDKIKNRNKEG